MCLVSIIIRTKNEEQWIAHCLEMVFKQTYKDLEVIIVDNDSSDYTVDIAKRYPVDKIISIAEFRPGLAINDGIRASKGKFIVCLSAHCIPKQTNWLTQLLSNFSEESVAGVYGRQLPLAYTDAIGKRDLLMVFGQDKRVQIKDYFFHNANSMFRREVWEKFNFDELVTNIEDRVWGKAVIDAGFKLIYEPLASVYHHHGLHQGNDPKRASGVVSIIEQTDKEIMGDVPDSLKPENVTVAALMPIKGDIDINSVEYQSIQQAVKDLKNSEYVNSIHLITIQPSLAEKLGVKWIDRRLIADVDTASVDKVLAMGLAAVEAGGEYPDSIIYVNYHYTTRPPELFDNLIRESQYKGFDTVFPGYKDFGHYWYQNESMDFIEIDPSMSPRDGRTPIIKALYGLGCLTSSTFLRRSKMIGGKVGILEVKDVRMTINLKNQGVV